MYLEFRDSENLSFSRPSDGVEGLTESVKSIIDDVRKRGDAALYDYALRFDSSRLDFLYVSDEEFEEAEKAVSPELKAAIALAAQNIRKFHEAEMPEGENVETESGVRCWRKIVPLSRVGLYVPGGTAPLFSTVLMLAIPATVAGCREIVLATPAKNGALSPAILYAARISGVRRVLKVGGAQAIAAMAYGTESVPRCDKLFGPGNSYVTEAKRQVSSDTAIDMLAGPSEVLVAVDSSSCPEFAASDLLSQAEHDELASAILVTTSEELAEAVSKEVDGFLQELSRSEIIRKSLDNYGYILVAESMEDAIDIANEIASEHLEIQTRNPYDVMTRIRNAGAIFIGEYASEPLGDYFAGPNHVLPTNGTARFFSPLSVDDFIKKSSIIGYSREALERIHTDIEAFAQAEQLTAHANSIKVRFEDKEA